MAMIRRAYSAAHFARAVNDASRPGTPSLFARLRAIPRMIRAVRAGQYTGVSSMRLTMLLAGVGYVVSPIDLVPEGVLLALGLVDDVMVIGWIVATLVRETEEFIAWERMAPASSTGWTEQGTPRGQWAPQGQTVPSHVVPD